jgi:hypothetical protein
MKASMTMRQARLAGYDKATVDMTACESKKTYTQNCYYDYSTYTLIWNDVVATLEDDEITTENGTRYYMTDFQSGHALLRPASSYDRYIYITETNDTVKSFRSNVEFAQYHYFNQNGAYKQHRAMMNTLTQYVDAGHINSGWLIAHDANWEMGHIAKAATAKRAKNVCYYVERMFEKIEDTYTSIAQVHLGEKDCAGQPTGEKK